jgi:hypothetical protein
MGSMSINGLMISKNAKTGVSINVDRCQPTAWCAIHCYRKARSAELIKQMGWDTTANNGPITWATQQAAYKRNDRVLAELDATGQLEHTATEITCRLQAHGVTHLRGNGTGDLFRSLVVLYAFLALKGLRVFMFSRIPSMIRELADLCDELGVAKQDRPFVMGSVDVSTTPEAVQQLIEATRYINGRPALAYATSTSGKAGCEEIDKHPASEHIRVAFGYHTNHLHTKLGHKKECPATAGGSIKCAQCARCFGFSSAQK